MPLTFNIKRREGQNYSTTNNCELLRTCVTDVAFYKNKWMHTALQREYVHPTNERWFDYSKLLSA